MGAFYVDFVLPLAGHLLPSNSLGRRLQGYCIIRVDLQDPDGRIEDNPWTLNCRVDLDRGPHG